MKTKEILKNSIKYIILIALVASIYWTFAVLTKKPEVKALPDITVTATPTYTITTTKAVNIWPAGTILDQGLNAYFYATEPRLNYATNIDVSGLSKGQLNGVISTQIILQALDSNSKIYWSQILQSNTPQNFNLYKNSAAQADMTSYIEVPIALDITSIYNLAAETEKQLKFQSNNIKLNINSQITLEGMADGNKVSKAFVSSLPMTLQTTSFSIPIPSDVTAKINLVSLNTATKSEPLVTKLYKNWFVIVTDILLLLLLAISVLLNRKKVLKTAVEHNRYKEWITEGSVELKNKLIINIFKLKGLVDLAIDLDKRVIYDGSLKKYYVLEEDIAYVHDPEAEFSHFKKQQLGKLLMEQGLITPQQLETGLYYQQRIGTRLGESLIALGFIDEGMLYSTLAAQQGIDYYELNTETQFNYKEWMDKMNLNKARALQSLPLGLRGDGKLVVACSEPSKEGIRKALQEIFSTEIFIVAVRPTILFEQFNKIEESAKVKDKSIQLENKAIIIPDEILKAEEIDSFIKAYSRGIINYGVFFKATGLIDEAVLSLVQEGEPIISWLVNRNYINSQTEKLVYGLNKCVLGLDAKSRIERQVPTILDLLNKSNYITVSTMNWISEEAKINKNTVEAFVTENHLVSYETVESALMILSTLESILK